MIDRSGTAFHIRQLRADELVRQGQYARQMLFASLAAMSSVIGLGAYFLSLMG
jgi:hypothetical protein